MKAKYRVHRFDIRMASDQSKLEQFLNSVEGDCSDSPKRCSPFYIWGNGCQRGLSFDCGKDELSWKNVYACKSDTTRISVEQLRNGKRMAGLSTHIVLLERLERSNTTCCLKRVSKKQNTSYPQFSTT